MSAFFHLEEKHPFFEKGLNHDSKRFKDGFITQLAMSIHSGWVKTLAKIPFGEKRIKQLSLVFKISNKCFDGKEWSIISLYIYIHIHIYAYIDLDLDR